MDYGYEGTAVFPFDLSALQQLPLGNTKLKAHVQWLVCREVCLPGKDAAPARIAAATVAVSASIWSVAPAARAAFTCNAMQ